MTTLLDHSLALTGLRAFTLLTLTFIVTSFLLRNRGSAALRSFVWTATLAAICLLPLLSRTMPPIHLGVIPAEGIQSIAAPPLLQIPNVGLTEHKAAPSSPPTTPKNLEQKAANPRLIETPLKTRTRATGFEFTIPVVWATGFILIVLSSIAGWLSLTHLRRRATLCPDGPLTEDVTRICKLLGINRAVEVRLTAQRDVPMTWGTFRSVLLLPSAAAEWSAEQRQTVLLHELAHVSRCDSVIQWLGQLATALYWYNPLVWLSVKQLRAEQERACDDTVLRHGTSATTYAVHLTHIVSGRGTDPLERSIGLAAGRPGRLEQRIRDILALHRNRKLATSRAIFTSSVIALVTTLLIGSVTPFRPALNAATPSTPSAQQPLPLEDLVQLQEALVDKSLHPVDAAALQRTAIEGMLESLNDPHAAYLSARTLADMQVQLEGELFGIGAQLRLEDDKLIVVRPIPGSPAMDAGLHANDIVTAVDGRPTAGESLTTLVAWIRGPLNTQIALTIDRSGNTMKLNVTRGRIQLPTLYGLRGVSSGGKQEPNLIGSGTDIGYFHITAINRRTPTELNDQIKRLVAEGMKSAILDLRNCPGGPLEPATQIADLFLESGDLVHIEGRDGTRQIITATATNHWKFPLLVLVNDVTASAAEIVCGALQDHNRAIIVGTRTHGKASVQSLVHINPSLGAVKLTTAHYFPPTGQNIDRQPGKDTWGINANDGFFVSLAEPNKAQVRDRLQGIVEQQAEPLELASLGARVIERELQDVQLSKSIEALETYQSSGQFPKIGGSRSELQAYVQSQALKSQQTELLNKLNAIQSAVTELVD